MLITFSCDAYENITLFGSVAHKLLAMMGHSKAVPSAIVAEDVPAALNQLEHALKNESDETETQPSFDHDNEEPISLNKRAIPVIALLKAAVKAQCDVMIS